MSECREITATRVVYVYTCVRCRADFERGLPREGVGPALCPHCAVVAEEERQALQAGARWPSGGHAAPEAAPAPVLMLCPRCGAERPPSIREEVLRALGHEWAAAEITGIVTRRLREAEGRAAAAERKLAEYEAEYRELRPPEFREWLTAGRSREGNG